MKVREGQTASGQPGQPCRENKASPTTAKILGCSSRMQTSGGRLLIGQRSEKGGEEGEKGNPQYDTVLAESLWAPNSQFGCQKKN